MEIEKYVAMPGGAGGSDCGDRCEREVPMWYHRLVAGLWRGVLNRI